MIPLAILVGIWVILWVVGVTVSAYKNPTKGTRDAILRRMYEVELKNGWFDPKDKSFEQWLKEI